MQDWAVVKGSSRVIAWGAVANVALAAWLFVRTATSPAPARWLYLGCGLLGLVSAGILGVQWYRSSRLLALPRSTSGLALIPPPSAAPVRTSLERITVEGAGVVERGRFLSDQERAHLATVTPQELSPGWYGDPLAPTGSRFWNGTQWTGRVSTVDPGT